jgi:hypothetical protein
VGWDGHRVDSGVIVGSGWQPGAPTGQYVGWAGQDVTTTG